MSEMEEKTNVEQEEVQTTFDTDFATASKKKGDNKNGIQSEINSAE